MNSNINKASLHASTSSSITDAGSSKVESPNTVENLSYMQKQRFDYLSPIFKDETAKLVTLIEGRGRNSWTKVNEKITSLEQANNADQNYHDALYDNFVVGTTYSIAEIPGIVAGVRRDLGLRPYISRLRTNCENDFFNLFIVQDAFTAFTEPDGTVKPKHTGYTPIFKLKPED